MKVCIKEYLNIIPYLNDYLDNINNELAVGDVMECYSFTAHQEYNAIKKKYPIVIREAVMLWIYTWHEVCPKLKSMRKFYFAMHGERHRTYSHTEILGRICRAGFKIKREENRHGLLHVIAEKRSEPLERNDTCVSPILRLQRVGKDGELIDVYKFRTMHSYSQYLQDYVYQLHHLNKNGKLANDFRVNIWGRIMRPIWLDELPMLWNVVRGDLKWVGVRPLSEHFFSLYTPEMQKLRTKVKPGMLPPFYYEKKTPTGLDEIQASERRYIEAYLIEPFKTDWRYFWGTVSNIVIHRKRSK